MARSIYVVGAMGVLGCVALSMMMQHLLKVQKDRSSSPLAADLQEMCGHLLAAPPEVRSFLYEGEQTIVIGLVTVDQVDRQKFGKSASELLWRGVYRLREMPERVRVELRTAGREDIVVVESRPPGFRNRGSGAPASDGASAGDKAVGTTPKVGPAPQGDPVPRATGAGAPAPPRDR